VLSFESGMLGIENEVLATCTEYVGMYGHNTLHSTE
jgi:hypothetical protein